MSDFLQHHLIDPSGGVLSSVAWGKNALQTANKNDNTPKTPQQAIGFKGIVDYTSGAQTSEVSLDAVLVESCSEAVSIYDHANYCPSGVGKYALTSFGATFAHGQPTTVKFGYITSGIPASGFVEQADPGMAETDTYSVVLGDDGEGIAIDTDIPIVMSKRGIQSINFSGSISRDPVGDVRSINPELFQVTFPLQISVDIEATFAAEGISPSGTYHLNVTSADGSKIYVGASGLQLNTRGESAGVGQNMSDTLNFIGSDLLIPLSAPVGEDPYTSAD
jgi:hypothetical protein